MISVDYGTSMIMAKSGDSTRQGDGTDVSGKKMAPNSKKEAAANIKVGIRMPSFKVLNQADARPWHLQELLKSNSRWRVAVFAGDLTDPANFVRIRRLDDALYGKESLIYRFTPQGKPVDSVIDILTVHSGRRLAVEMLDLPEIFHPWSETEGWDYWKVFVDDDSYHEGHSHAYQQYGVDSKDGAAVILRPDQ